MMSAHVIYWRMIMMRKISEDEMADYKEEEAIQGWKDREASRLADKAWREWYYPWERVVPENEEE
jgi:hypothetical protein